jgi:hypothetical protein
MRANKSELPLADRIHSVRGQRIMLDFDLAELYGVPTKALVQAVKRNRDRFPADFAFPLANHDVARLRSQIVTSKEPSPGRGGRRTVPLAFTEQGVAMLSSVLKSNRAVQVNIEIMRAFVRMRGLASHNHELARRLDDLESKYDHQFKVVFDAIRALVAPPTSPKRRIGFVQGD